VRRHEETAFRAAYLIVRDEAEAQDVAQEAFVRAHRALARFDERRPFRPWLLRIVTNLAFNSVRGAQRRDAMTERYERHAMTGSAAPSPESSAVQAEQARRLWQAIGALDEHDQEVLYLRYFLDASEEETARAIGRPPGTVKSRLHRALARLRDVIEAGYPDLAPQPAAHAEGGSKA
jgi:RNA polymerase sigma-70 factor (ECF subfamily)